MTQPTISEAFAAAREQRRGALIIYLTGGFPNLTESAGLITAAADAGADIIEVGLPFSDPVADGPTIQDACSQALASGTTVAGILSMISGLSETISVPIVIMSCFQPILSYGTERFAADAVQAGVSGVLVADLPPSESQAWRGIALANGLDTIFLVAPSTKPERLAEILELATGFVYVLSRQGVTGERADLPESLADLVNHVREQTDVPVAVGFGISDARQVASVCASADGAIVGSAVVRAAAEAETPEQRRASVHATVAALASGCRPPHERAGHR